MTADRPQSLVCTWRLASRAPTSPAWLRHTSRKSGPGSAADRPA